MKHKCSLHANRYVMNASMLKHSSERTLRKLNSFDVHTKCKKITGGNVTANTIPTKKSYRTLTETRPQLSTENELATVVFVPA